MLRSKATRAASLLCPPGLCGDFGVETDAAASDEAAFCWDCGVRGKGGAAIGYLVGGEREGGWLGWLTASGEAVGDGEARCAPAAEVCQAGACAGTAGEYGAEV